MLKEIIANGYYTFAQQFDSWEDAIKASYEPLLKKQIVEEIYIQSPTKYATQERLCFP